jgi:hypothetical protein
MCFASASRRLATSSSVYSMDFDLSAIRMRLRLRLERFRFRVKLALLLFLMRVTIKLASPDQKEHLVAEQEALKQAAGEKWRSVHKGALFRHVGFALSSWAGMETSLVGIACLLLRTKEANKIGTILYSLSNFHTWLSIIGDLFLLEPLYIDLMTRWNKINNRLRELNDIRVRLAHHTLYYGDQDTTIAADTSLVPGRFDVRPKSQKHRF